MKHIVCYSGGHSSALVAIEVTRRYGKENVILLNHDINKNVEDSDIKRFKSEVAEYLGVPITYCNYEHWDTKDQFDVCMEAKAFKYGSVAVLCTKTLKTAPFEKFLNDNFADKNCTIYYGFDANESKRIQRRIGVLANMGFKSAYPLAHWERTIQSTKDIGIEPPMTYGLFKHANCTGCLKAGKQHWYIVYLHRKDLWEKAKQAEELIGYSIIKDYYLDELEPIFDKMRCNGITTTEHEKGVTFFARVKRDFPEVYQDGDEKPCECVF